LTLKRRSASNSCCMPSSSTRQWKTTEIKRRSVLLEMSAWGFGRDGVSETDHGSNSGVFFPEIPG
jgi:hypothetical protein